MNRTKKQHRIGMKIQTIVGRRLMHSNNWKPTPAEKEMAHVPGANLNNKKHEVRIVGYSHLRGTTTKIDQYLNKKFEVCSWIKPGANTEELVDTLERDFKCLRKKDVIVIGGANDIGSKRNQTNKVLVKMAQFIQKHNNSNIIVITFLIDTCCGYKITGLNFFPLPCKLGNSGWCVVLACALPSIHGYNFKVVGANSLAVAFAGSGLCSCSLSETC